MEYIELTEKERIILAQIASDMQSGRHLLRDEKWWENKPYTKYEYERAWDDLMLSIRAFSWYETNDFATRRNLEFLICFKSYSNYDFDKIING